MYLPKSQHGVDLGRMFTGFPMIVALGADAKLARQFDAAEA